MPKGLLSPLRGDRDAPLGPSDSSLFPFGEPLRFLSVPFGDGPKPTTQSGTQYMPKGPLLCPPVGAKAKGPLLSFGEEKHVVVVGFGPATLPFGDGKNQRTARALWAYIAGWDTFQKKKWAYIASLVSCPLGKAKRAQYMPKGATQERNTLYSSALPKAKRPPKGRKPKGPRCPSGRFALSRYVPLSMPKGLSVPKGDGPKPTKRRPLGLSPLRGDSNVRNIKWETTPFGFQTEPLRARNSEGQTARQRDSETARQRGLSDL